MPVLKYRNGNEWVNLSCVEVNTTSITTYSGILYANGWSSSAPYSQTITVTGILGTDTPFVDIDMSSASTSATGSALLEAWGMIGRITVTANNTVVAYCYEEKPTVNVPIILKVVR